MEEEEGTPHDLVCFLHSTFSKGEPLKRHYTPTSKRPFFSGTSIVSGLICPTRNLSIKALPLPETFDPQPPDRTVDPTPGDGLSPDQVDDFEGVNTVAAMIMWRRVVMSRLLLGGSSWSLVNGWMMVSLLILD
ncbi:hypothetical protein AMTR_s00040p00029280 [Amborella trichopoda]|uniref:Uncharacterized protein n=1 Tax=Amborella trichopoda TaxID=13333 RepID=W1PSG1_AMBTC|nr:hypothetical protein AMTR_s00040p00029280 [Amborella trichopoda]